MSGPRRIAAVMSPMAGSGWSTRAPRLIVLLALCVIAPRAEGQQAPAKRVTVALVEGDTTWIERTHTIAAIVRTRLERHATRDQLRVVRRKDVVDLCDSGCPDRWTPEYLHEVAIQVGADVVVELTTSVQGGEVTAQALVHHPSTRAVDTLAPVRGVADTVVARELAWKLSLMLERLYEQKLDSAPGAARVVSVPTRAYLVDLMRRRASDSPLGDLRRRATAPDDVEVRAWGGFGIVGSIGVVLRRERGVWRAWRAQVVRCDAKVALPIADTASATTGARFIALARRKCDASIGDVSRTSRLFQADTIAITELKADGRAIERAWDTAVQEGLLTLPPEVPRKWIMIDGVVYVIEVRRGAEYRASTIEKVDKPEVPADAQVKRVFEALTGLVPVAPARIPGP